MWKYSKTIVFLSDHGSPDPWGHHITSSRGQQGHSVPGSYSAMHPDMVSHNLVCLCFSIQTFVFRRVVHSLRRINHFEGFLHQCCLDTFVNFSQGGHCPGNLGKVRKMKTGLR